MQEVRVGRRRRRGRKGRHGREKICTPGFGFGLHTLSYLRASIKVPVALLLLRGQYEGEERNRDTISPTIFTTHLGMLNVIGVTANMSLSSSAPLMPTKWNSC